MLLNPTASSSSSSSRLLQECPSIRLVCLSHSWAVLKQLDWIEMPFCNARRLALANSMPYCVRWWPDLHPRPPGEGAISVGKIRPIVKCGHNAWQCRRSWWQNDLISSIQTWHNPSAWPPAKVGVARWYVIRPMPLVLGRQAEPDSDSLAQCPCPQSTASF